jgi:hypothetical protein
VRFEVSTAVSTGDKLLRKVTSCYLFTLLALGWRQQLSPKH